PGPAIARGLILPSPGTRAGTKTARRWQVIATPVVVGGTIRRKAPPAAAFHLAGGLDRGTCARVAVSRGAAPRRPIRRGRGHPREGRPPRRRAAGGSDRPARHGPAARAVRLDPVFGGRQTAGRRGRRLAGPRLGRRRRQAPRIAAS